MKYLKQNKKAEHDDGSSKMIQSKEKKIEKREQKPSGPRGIKGLKLCEAQLKSQEREWAEVLFLEMAENFTHFIKNYFKKQI